MSLTFIIKALPFACKLEYFFISKPRVVSLVNSCFAHRYRSFLSTATYQLGWVKKIKLNEQKTKVDTLNLREEENRNLNERQSTNQVICKLVVERDFTLVPRIDFAFFTEILELAKASCLLGKMWITLNHYLWIVNELSTGDSNRYNTLKCFSRKQTLKSWELIFMMICSCMSIGNL